MSTIDCIRVLMVSLLPDDPEKVIGGVAGLCSYLCQSLAKRDDIELELVVQQSGFSTIRKSRHWQSTITYLPRLNGRMRVPTKISSFVHAYARERNFDILHGQAVPSWILGLKTIPTVVTIHGLNEQDMLYRGNRMNRRFCWPLSRFIEQRRRSQCDNLILSSPYVKQALKNSIQGNAWTIDNPVRDDFFTTQRNAIPNQILFAGIICRRKNLLNLIRAMPQIANRVPDVRLRVAGEPSDTNYDRHCKATAKKLGIAHRIDWLGTLTVHEMRTEISRAASLALCSYQETAPVVISEAMAVGTPVVTSNRCGMPYMIDHGKTGYLVDPGSIDSIACGIVKSLQTQQDEQTMRACRSVAERRYRGDHVASKTVEVYRSVIHHFRIPAKTR